MIEYRIVEKDYDIDRDELDELGSVGWELAAATQSNYSRDNGHRSIVYYFKRSLPLEGDVNSYVVGGRIFKLAV